MAITNGYCSLAEIRAQLGITDAGDTTEDAALEILVESVSRAIDDWTSRQFYAATQTRYYTAMRRDVLLVDDLLSVTSLKTDDDDDGTYETTWAATDYYLGPYNAQLESVPQPYTRIEAASSGDYWFPVRQQRGVQIVGSWGFAATTPKVVKNACLFQAALEHRSTDAPLGVSGNDDIGQTVRLTALHPVTRRLLEPYRRIVVA